MERDVANIEGLYVEGIKLDRFCEASVVGLGLILIRVLGPQRFKYSTHSPTACLKAKKKDAWRLAQAVILFLAIYFMSSWPILVFV